MGWIYTHKPSYESVSEFFQRTFNYVSDDGHYGKVIDCAVVNFHTAYLAYEFLSSEGKPEVMGIVCKLDYAPTDHYNFGYKEIDESSAPFEAECPERILRLLTPARSEWAQIWRDSCWQNLANKKVRLTRGKRVRSPKPIQFTNGESYQVFTVVSAKDKLFRTEDGELVQIKRKVKWQDLSKPIKEPSPLYQGGMF